MFHYQLPLCIHDKHTMELTKCWVILCNFKIANFCFGGKYVDYIRVIERMNTDCENSSLS